MFSKWTIAVVAALGLAVAVPSADAAVPDKARCIQELAKAGLADDVNAGQANFVLGTEDSDNLSGQLTSGVDVVCGFGGNDTIAQLGSGDIFLGGAGGDFVHTMDGGTFIGGEGPDGVLILNGGTFNGGASMDDVGVMEGGTFNGGDGGDLVIEVRGGTFNGGAGEDVAVVVFPGGTFNQD